MERSLRWRQYRRRIVTAQADLLWTRPEWLAEAKAWVHEHVDVTGEIEQPHVYWWSTVLRVPTAGGDVWFKACHPSHGFEPALTIELARLRPERVIEVLAVDPQRGWMVTADAGSRLRELLRSADDLARWEEFLPLYADVQLAAADKAERLLGLGVPDERLEGLPTRFGHVLADRDVLLVDREDGLDAGQHERLRASVPEVERLCAELAAVGIPETVQHDDLHDGNVFVRNGEYLVFDWGDSCVSHPFHTLAVTLRTTAWRFDLEPGAPSLERMRDAYLEPFGAYGTRAELLDAFAIGYRLGTIARALSWYRAVQAYPEIEPDQSDSVPYGLKLFLRNEPIGTWQ
jgi:Phosphotransferase enzyme family